MSFKCHRDQFDIVEYLLEHPLFYNLTDDIENAFLRIFIMTGINEKTGFSLLF